MPVSPTYPGVYIEEIPSGVHTIIGAATSITAFLGRTLTGPVNRALTLTSFADFEANFGGIDVDYPLGYAVADFFAGGGTQAVVARLFSDAGSAAAQAVATAAEASADPDPNKVAAAAADKAKEFTVAPAKEAADAVAAAAATAAATAGATAQSVKDAARAKADSTTDTSTASLSPAGNANFKLEATGPGTWGNKLLATVDNVGITSEVAERYNITDPKMLFNLSVYNN